jgi:ABC-2 type transport system ATP-binding protein
MLQRIGLAQALLNAPALVFLDEPTSALDPFGRRLVRGIIRDLKAQGTTVFLNSHLLGEVEATCDRVSFIKEGRILRTLNLDDLQAHRLTVELRVDSAPPPLLAALQAVTGTEPHIIDTLPGGEMAATLTTLELVLTDEDMLPALAERTLAHGARLYALTPRRVSLEQYFLEIVGMDDSGQ